MRWINKGEELDCIGEKFKSKKKVYIYGAGEYGKELFEKMDYLGCIEAFIDQDVTKQNKGYLGKKVLSPEHFFAFKPDNHSLLIIASALPHSTYMLKKSIFAGWEEGVNCFEVKRFSEEYLSIYSMYGFQKLHLNIVALLIFGQCTLKCKKCSSSLPYFKTDPFIRDINICKKDMDILFDKVDFIEEVHLGTGEVLKYKELPFVLEYLCQKYTGRFGKVVIITNGTVIPDKEILDIVVMNNIEIRVTDYTDTLPQLKKKFKGCIQVFEEMNINYTIIKHNYWGDFGVDENNYKVINEEEMITFFDQCNNKCRAYFDGKYYFCAVSMCMQFAFDNKKGNTDYLDLKNDENLTSKIILEYDLGFNKVGYIKDCRWCNGYPHINKKHIIPGIQLIKKQCIYSKGDEYVVP